MVQKHPPRFDGWMGQATEGCFVPHVIHLRRMETCPVHMCLAGVGWSGKAMGCLCPKSDPSLTEGPTPKAFLWVGGCGQRGLCPWQPPSSVHHMDHEGGGGGRRETHFPVVSGTKVALEDSAQQGHRVWPRPPSACGVVDIRHPWPLGQILSPQETLEAQKQPHISEGWWPAGVSKSQKLETLGVQMSAQPGTPKSDHGPNTDPEGKNQNHGDSLLFACSPNARVICLSKSACVTLKSQIPQKSIWRRDCIFFHSQRMTKATYDISSSFRPNTVIWN